jgi:hypothetical protein
MSNAEGSRFYDKPALQLLGAASCLRKQAIQAATVLREPTSRFPQAKAKTHYS